MVVSKKCKICTTLDANNIPISGEYFGKQIPDVIAKLTGIELDPRKVDGTLICQQCSIMLIHTEAVVDKLRKKLLRLANTKKTAKTPRKISKGTTEVGTETPKKGPTIQSAKVNGDTPFRKITDDAKSLHGVAVIAEKETPTPMENPKRKLAYQEEIGINEAPKAESVTKKPKRTSENLEDNSFSDLHKSNGQEKKRTNNSISLNNGCESYTDEVDIYNDTADEHSFKETKTKDLNCVLCGKKYNHKRMLREHIESSHMGEKLKECPNCYMEFRSVQKYESHVFSEKCKTTLHPCQFEHCNRRFKNVYKMEDHMKEKHFSTNNTGSD